MQQNVKGEICSLYMDGVMSERLKAAFKKKFDRDFMAEDIGDIIPEPKGWLFCLRDPRGDRFAYTHGVKFADIDPAEPGHWYTDSGRLIK